MDAIRETLRGEPLIVRAVAIAALVVVYAVVTGDWDKETIAGMLLPLVQAVITRPAVTPTANPAQPTTIAVRQTNGEEHAELPPNSLPPIRTLTGARR